VNVRYFATIAIERGVVTISRLVFCSKVECNQVKIKSTSSVVEFTRFTKKSVRTCEFTTHTHLRARGDSIAFALVGQAAKYICKITFILSPELAGVAALC